MSTAVMTDVFTKKSGTRMRAAAFLTCFELLCAGEHNRHAVGNLKGLERLNLSCRASLRLVVAAPCAFQIADLGQKAGGGEAVIGVVVLNGAVELDNALQRGVVAFKCQRFLVDLLVAVLDDKGDACLELCGDRLGFRLGSTASRIAGDKSTAQQIQP